MAMNYTKEQTDYIVTRYSGEPTRETVDALANDLDKSSKSIIGKLSREGVYQRAIYKNKVGELPVTKLELVSLVSEFLELDPESSYGVGQSS